MRSPTFVPASHEEVIRESEKDIREILRQADKRAHELFERRDPRCAGAFRELPETRVEEEAGER
jgi:hypothetical protein